MFILLGLLALAMGAGFIGALSGLGGGVFIVPALLIFAHIPMGIAVGASMISVVATSAGASVAFVRDGWTNLRVARVLELLFALMMLQSAYFTVTKAGDSIVPQCDALAERLRLGGRIPAENGGQEIEYGVVNVPGGAILMVVAGLMSGLLGIGSGALKVVAVGH